MLAGDPAGSSQGARPGSAMKMQQQKNSLAARRAERMQANIYQSNQSTMSRQNPNSPMAPRPPMGGGGSRGGGYADANGQGYGYDGQQQGQGGSVYGLRSTYDPNEEENGGMAHTSSMQRAGTFPRQPIPQGPRIDLSDIRTFLMTPGPRNGPVMCYIVRDKGSAKMYPKVRRTSAQVLIELG